MEITVSRVKELRMATGAGVLDCRNTLESTAGDFDKALAILREKGFDAAAKKAERAAPEGLIGHVQSEDGRLAALVQVNCETDFVALTPAFSQLSQDLAQLVADCGRDWRSVEDLLAQAHPERGQIVADLLRTEIVRFGENVVVKGFARFELPADALGRRIVLYVHPGSRMASLVDLACAPEAALAHPEFPAFAKDIALQVVAARPAWVSRDEVPAEVLAGQIADIRAELAAAGRAAPEWERVVEGRLQKFYEEKCLLDQPFIRDDSRRIQDVIDAAALRFASEIKIVRAAHLAIGD